MPRVSTAAQAMFPGGSLSPADRYLAKNNLVDASKSDEAGPTEEPAHYVHRPFRI